MPSSLIFAALAAAWLIVLVPIFARRRQEVSRTTDTALAARVVRRGSDRPPAGSESPATDRVREEHAMPEHDRDRAGGNDIDDRYEHDDRHDVEPDDGYGDHGYGEYEDDEARQVHSDDVRAGRRYRPGRGGFDPEAAAQVARAKYAHRQRTVLLLLIAAITTAVLAAFVTSGLWWVHALMDLTLVGYLVYLRKQVRVENEVRERRLARLSGARDEPPQDDQQRWDWHEEPDRDWDQEPEDGWDEDLDEDPEYHGADVAEAPAPRREPRTPVTANAIALDIDDEDPDFDELDERLWQPYRRAAGE